MKLGLESEPGRRARSEEPPPPPLAAGLASPRLASPRLMTDQLLHHRINHQLAYYFSPHNLAHDDFLRRHMDPNQGWVPIQLIATFKRLRALTTDIQLITSILANNPIFDVQQGNVRLKDHWQHWVLPHADAPNLGPVVRPPSRDIEMLLPVFVPPSPDLLHAPCTIPQTAWMAEPTAATCPPPPPARKVKSAPSTPRTSVQVSLHRSVSQQPGTSAKRKAKAKRSSTSENVGADIASQPLVEVDFQELDDAETVAAIATVERAEREYQLRIQESEWEVQTKGRRRGPRHSAKESPSVPPTEVSLKSSQWESGSDDIVSDATHLVGSDDWSNSNYSETDTAVHFSDTLPDVELTKKRKPCDKTSRATQAAPRVACRRSSPNSRKGRKKVATLLWHQSAFSCATHTAGIVRKAIVNLSSTLCALAASVVHSAQAVCVSSIVTLLYVIGLVATTVADAANSRFTSLTNHSQYVRYLTTTVSKIPWHRQRTQFMLLILVFSILRSTSSTTVTSSVVDLSCGILSRPSIEMAVGLPVALCLPAFGEAAFNFFSPSKVRRAV